MTADSPQSSPADNPLARRKRRLWQFGLSTLLLIVTACAVVSWWYSREPWEAFQQRFTERIEKLGAYIEWGNAESPTKLSFRCWGPWVEPTKKALTDEQLQKLRRDLGRLGPFALNIGGTPNARGMITDAGIEHLEGLPRLECLCLRHTDVTDVGLERLGRIKGLQFVDLRYTKVTGEATRGMSRSDLVVCSEEWQAVPSESSSAKWKPPFMLEALLAVGYCSLEIQSKEMGEVVRVDLPRNDVFMPDPQVRSLFVSPNDLLVTLHGPISDSGVQVARIDLAASHARVMWEAYAQPLGVDHSKYRHDAHVFVQGNRCVLVSDGAETFVEIRDLASGALLKRWVY